MAVKETRGGRRAGAGRPKKIRSYSDKVKTTLVSELRKLAKEKGKSWQRVLGEIVYSDGNPLVVVSACKRITEILVVQESHKTVESHSYAPVLLPVQEDDPARPEVDQTVN